MVILDDWKQKPSLKHKISVKEVNSSEEQEKNWSEHSPICWSLRLRSIKSVSPDYEKERECVGECYWSDYFCVYQILF